MTSLAERFGRSALQRVAQRRGDAPTAADVMAEPAPTGIQPTVRNRTRTAPAIPLPVPSTTGPVAGAVTPFMPAIPEDMLKKVIDAQDKAPQKSRVGVQTYTHISTLTQGVCTRHYAINAVHTKEDWDGATGGHQLMWKYGRAAEAHIRNQATAATGLRFSMWGDWVCACERTKHTGTKPKDMSCRTCQTPVRHFREHALHDHENEIVGNCDLPIILGRYFVPYEFKSMNKKDWDKLNAPLVTHVMQCLGYRHLFQQEGFLVHDKIGFLYAAKEFTFGSPYKEYHIDATEPQNVRMLGQMLEQAQDIKRAKASKIVPPRMPVCISPDAPRAKSCPRVSLCFNLPA